MVLKEKEKQAIKDLQTLEQACIDKYGKYAAQAKDPVLQELFTTLKGNEQKHYDSLEQVLTGTVPNCNCNDSDVFIFGDSAIRKLLADIQIEEQNHAEMLFKYKTVNGMA